MCYVGDGTRRCLRLANQGLSWRVSVQAGRSGGRAAAPGTPLSGGEHRRGDVRLLRRVPDVRSAVGRERAWQELEQPFVRTGRVERVGV